jgi:hypothetical protein
MELNLVNNYSMKIIKLYTFHIFIFLFCSPHSKAQIVKTTDSTLHKKIRNIIPRIGIGMSRHFLSEFGIAYMSSNFYEHKDFGLNTNLLIYYLSLEVMTPYKRPITYGYKIGIETINIGHVTSAGGIEVGYFKKDTVSSVVIFPKIGIPLINGSLSYGIGFYFNADMKKEIGKHRITLTYCFNRKSNKVLYSLLDSQRKKVY